MDEDFLDPIELPIDGTLDLHTFQASEVKKLVPDYLDACLKKRILTVRIIHGKGRGVLRNMVHSILKRHPAVLAFYHDDSSGGGWGATVVKLNSNFTEK